MAEIVVGIDEVGRCARAADWAVCEAPLRGAQLHLLHCCNRFDCRVLDETVDRIRPLMGDLRVVAEPSTAAPETALLRVGQHAAMLVVGPPWSSSGLGALLVHSTSLHVALHAASAVVVAHARQLPTDNRVVVGFPDPRIPSLYWARPFTRPIFERLR